MQPEKISFAAKDGVKIPAFIYGGEEKSIKGTVIIVHGFGEHAGSYRELAEHIKQANYAGVIFDQRGHGHLADYPPEKRGKYCGVIPSYQSFLDDIDAIAAEIKQIYPNKPVILYGHSMGGNIAANYLLKHRQSDFSCAVLESPWFGLYKEVSPFTAVAAKLLGRLSPGITTVSKLPHSDVTGDKIKAEEMKNDPLYHNRISLRMFSGIRNACIYAIKNSAKLSIPIYLAYARHERIVNNQAIQKFYSSCGDNVKIVEYDSCHAIHNDLKRQDFYSDIVAFINEHSGFINK
jgi:alpha-beta hydrolase superfamily lysophospholipase